MSIPPKIIVILGPSSSGKSDLAVSIAKKFNGEVISADSRQVYRGLDIGSGKVTKKEMRGICHHCLSYVSAKKNYTIVDWKKCAEKNIKDILKRGKLPIVCGGTGFYIQSIVDNIVIPEVKANLKLRKELEKKTTEELFKMLKKLDPKRAKTIDFKNPRRIIRAIEIAKAFGKVPQPKPKTETGFRFLQIGIKLPEKELEKKIEKRIKCILKKGLIKETKKLHNSGLTWKRIYELGFEYKYPAMYLQGRINKDELLEKLIQRNRQYAKRQMTWFKRDKRIKWVKNKSETLKITKNFIS